MIRKIFKDNWNYLVVILFLILLFHLVINSSWYNTIISFDNSFFESINDFRSEPLTIIFRIFTFFGEIYIPLAILICLFFAFKKKWIFAFQAGSYAIAGAITYLSKLLIARPRPLSALIKIPSSYSFPSGHTLTSIVFYVMLAYLLTYNSKKEVRNSTIVLATFFALFISFSRPYLGVHYLSDILGGMILSIPILLMLINIINKNFKKEISGK